ncbi:MAG TPA: Ig-like domain-containing protein [Candidatus Acidoferrum sp.]|nr:Ig-like domain-containing protein [Candidatus Acidoferrum sp.]
MKAHATQLIAITVAASLLAAAALAQNAKQPTVRNMPPSVIKTVPASGSTDVDPSLTELTFTFSKPMRDQSWSVCQSSDDTFPGSGEGKMHYQADRRTCVMPVKLQPGKTYVLWLNRGQYMNFRDTQGNSSVPYLLVFETKK